VNAVEQTFVKTCKYLYAECLRRLVAVRNYNEVDEDGDLYGMRSAVSFVNDDVEGLFINGFSQLGFLLNNGLRVIGPCAIFPRSILHWNVGFIRHSAVT